MKTLRHPATALLLIALSATKIISAGEFLPVINPTFANVPIQCDYGYAYQSRDGGNCGSSLSQQTFNGTLGIGWTFSPNGQGITGPNTPFQPPSFTDLPFNRAAFLQGTPGGVSQEILGFVEGFVYRLSFYVGSRYLSNAGNQTVVALIDGRVIGAWSLVSFTPFALQTKSFRVATSGPHVLTFAGAASGDQTAFFSGVSIEALQPDDEK
jgi:hypothetical protein